MPSPISIASLAPVSENPALVGLSEPSISEAGLSEVSPNEAGLSGINYYTLYIIKFDSLIWIILIIYLLLFQVSLHRWSGKGEVYRKTSRESVGDVSTRDSISRLRYQPATPDPLGNGVSHDRSSWASYAIAMPL